jgi:hypothetical protein
MAERKHTSSKEMLLIGCIAGLAGLYFLLVGAGVLPIPGGPRNLHAPLWVVLAAGLAFFLGGTAVVLQAFGCANEQGEFPVGAPFWLRATQYLIGVAILASFGTIGGWIAFGPGERAFSGSLGFLSGNVSDAIGRTAFGLGALMIWLAAIGFAVAGARKLFRRSQDRPL